MLRDRARGAVLVADGKRGTEKTAHILEGKKKRQTLAR